MGCDEVATKLQGTCYAINNKTVKDTNLTIKKYCEPLQAFYYLQMFPRRLSLMNSVFSNKSYKFAPMVHNLIDPN